MRLFGRQDVYILLMSLVTPRLLPRFTRHAYLIVAGIPSILALADLPAQ
jgi:hypothetical protein